jgi:hypothetical protein
LKENFEDWAKTFFAVDGWPVIDGRAIFENPAIIPGLDNLRLNLPGRTLVVEYDPALWPPAWLDELMTTGKAERLRLLLNKMAETFLRNVEQN